MRPWSRLGACFRMVHSRERQTAAGLWSVGQAALSVTCQSLFVIFVASDAGHRRCSSQESDCLHLGSAGAWICRSRGLNHGVFYKNGYRECRVFSLYGYFSQSKNPRVYFTWLKYTNGVTVIAKHAMWL